MTWFIILLGLWIWWMSGYRQRKSLKQIAKEMPTTIPAWPLVGQTHIYLGTDEDRMKALQRLGRDAIQQGGAIAYWQGQGLYIGVADPVIADLLLKNCLTKDDRIMHFSRPFVGNGSLIAPVHIWRPRRKILSPIFSQKNLVAFVEVFAKQSAMMVELLRPMAGAGDFPIWKYVATYTFDAVLETNMGVKINSQTNVDHPFLGAFDTITALFGARLLQPWLYSDFIYSMLPSYKLLKKCVDIIDSFMSETILEKRKNLKILSEEKTTDTNKPKIKTVLEIILETPGKEQVLTDVELLEESKVIVAAGTDTSAVGACFTLLMLARHPEVQEAVYMELLEVFGDSNRAVTAKDLPQLKYLELVIKESLRLYPPVPGIVREVTNEIQLPNGTTLIKGIGIVMFIEAVHRNQNYWGDDADSFRPERFLEPLKHPAQYIPFSYGMRNCLGYQYAMLSLKTVLSTLLRSYQVLPPSHLKPAHYNDPLRTKYSIMMKDVDNFTVRLKERP